MNKETILYELEQCREDDRAALGQISQIIVVGVAAATILFAYIASPAKSNDEDSTFLLFAIIGIVIGVFSYITAVGLKSALRYHYMRELEAKLHVEPSDVGWVEISAPIITLNINHMKSKYTVIHFLCMIAAVLAAASACLVFVWYFARNEYSPEAIALVVVFTVIMTVLVVFHYIGTSNTEKLYKTAKELVQQRREAEGGIAVDENPRKEGKLLAKIKAVIYFIYPRPMDVLKIGFIAFGIAFGALCVHMESREALSRGLFIICIVDVLAYQARYQWNDLRGINEDDANPQGAKRWRLPLSTLGNKAIAISALTAILKVAGAIILVVTLAPDSMKMPLLVGIAAIFILATVYEIVREKKSIKGTLAIVSLGYPLRFFLGFWAIWPSVGDWFSASEDFACLGGMSISYVLVVVLILLGTAAFGASFVGLTWALEASDTARRGGIPRKRHVAYLGKQLGINLRTKYPLRSKGTLSQYWNWTMFVSLVLMSAALLLARPTVISSWLAVGAVNGVFCLMQKKPTSFVLCFLIVGIIAALSAVTFISLVLFDYVAPSCLVDSISLLLGVGIEGYMLIYLMFRHTNYEEMVSPPFIKSTVAFILGPGICRMLSENNRR